MSDAYVLIAVNVAVYLVLMAMVDRTLGNVAMLRMTPQRLLQAGGLYVPLVRTGQAFRLWSAGFLHASLMHLSVNMAALFLVWRRVGPELGAGLLVVYAVSLLGGALATAGFRWTAPVPSDEEINKTDRGFWADLWFGARRLKVSVGASGALCGLMGAGVAAGLLRHDADGTQLATDMGTWAVSTLIYGLEDHVDNAAHGGGLVAGAACGALLGLHPPLEAWHAMLMAAVLLTTAGAFGLAWRHRGQVELMESLVNRGAALANAGDLQGARVLYERALAMHPNHALAHANLARVQLAFGELDAAEREARTALDQEPGWDFAERTLRDVDARRAAAPIR